MKALKSCFCDNTNPDEFIIKPNKITCLECNTTRVSSTSSSVEEMIDIWNVRGCTPIVHSDAKEDALNELKSKAEEYLWRHNKLDIQSNYLVQLLKQFCTFYSKSS